MLGFKMTGLLCFVMAMLSGKHPPAQAQEMTTAADQRRDDSVVMVQAKVDANSMPITKLWEALSAERAYVTQMKIDAAAGRNYSTWLSGGGIAGILASLGLQLKPKRRRRGSGNDEDDE